MPVQSGSKVSQSIADMLHLLQFSNPEPPRLVHRLDKDTTGCLVLARTRDAATRLSTLFSDDSEDCVLQKKYQAVVCGTPSENSGRITTGIIQVGVPPREKLSVIEWHESDDLPDNKNAVKKAVSDFKILAKQKHVSHLELSPATGRKHQLRLHCAEFLKTPILGDYKYGPGCPKQLRSAFGNIKTVPIHLHMYEISIRDWYGEGKNLCVQAPLPAHFTRTLKTFNLGGKSSGDQDAVKAVDENSE
ncbi:pseudouridine synthase [Rhizoclosmatium globosum]|uniref:Pseudouridine synthase n=1 Tax=Rhizoclosmatium globosum TaxID=329046 RepID=A0A1Y2BZM4_9FUNG|nr:pseudouridine synthase [Rhizoclosmatium globosum]|eukprot:ORY40176.1 pseudouridine synthase [Rhizoclosmatium globosum]